MTKLVTDELGGAMRVTLGNITETMTDMWLAQQKQVSSLSKRSSSWDVAASTPPSYLQQVMDAMNNQFNMSGSSYTFTSFEQGTIYASGAHGRERPLDHGQGQRHAAVLAGLPHRLRLQGRRLVGLAHLRHRRGLHSTDCP